MSGIIEFSDSHENPDGMSQELREIISLAKTEDAILVGAGDIINLLPWGYDAWVGSPFLDEFREALGGYNFYWLTGNHDPHSWVKRLFGDWGNIIITRQLVWPAPLGEVEIRHGHRWSVDWRILRHIAPSFVEFMADHFTWFWYKFSERMGWLPSKLKEEGREHDYQRAILSVWYGAVGHAQRKGRRVIVGHTHSRGSLIRGDDVLVADGGTLREGDFIRIDKEIRLCKL